MRTATTPADIAPLFATWDRPWGFAGGWSIDLALDTVTRDHEDVDVAVLRGDADAIHELLSGWELFTAHDGELTRWLVDQPLPSERHAVWCRRGAYHDFEFELLFNDHTDTEWLFRRDHTVRRPLESTFGTTPSGQPILAPAIVLAFKAKSTRERDKSDFDVYRTHLPGVDRDWLLRTLARVHPHHAWIDRLTDTSTGLG